jgi:exopolyphosphatase / guanosine-5'-triphosphate,3'-diphosphate pyrophosphatase
MRVAIIDVGSNTARLLVAEISPSGAVVEIARDRVYLSLGAELARRGELSDAKIEEAAEVARRFAALASEHDLDHAEMIVTAPGRRGPSAPLLTRALQNASGWPVRVLSADDEGRLAYDGAVARTRVLPEVVAVVDVGGGSSEIVVGTPLLGAAWVRSLDTGSLRLTQHYLASDPPSKRQLAAARDSVRRALADVDPPEPDLALAAGGSARAIAKVVGRTFGRHELDEVARTFLRRSSRRTARALSIHPSRAETVVAGAIVLSEISQAIGRRLELADGGLREGAALSLALQASTAVAA